MAIREVVRMGHPVLLKVADPVSRCNDPTLDALVQDMRDTMQSLNGAGIAAPQIGVSLQVVIFGGFKSTRYPDAPDIPFTVLCNPLITPLDDEQDEDWEACLSVPGLRGLVPRYTRLRYQGFDAQGVVIDRTVDGFHARVVQHECDHLQGLLYPMRIPDLRNFGYSGVIAEAIDIED